MKTIGETSFDLGFYEGKASALRQAMVTVRYMSPYNDETAKLKKVLEREYNSALRLLDDAIVADIQAKRST